MVNWGVNDTMTYFQLAGGPNYEKFKVVGNGGTKNHKRKKK